MADLLQSICHMDFWWKAVGHIFTFNNNKGDKVKTDVLGSYIQKLVHTKSTCQLNVP